MNKKVKIEKVCSYCGAVFVAYKTTTEYCSHRCSSLAYKQRKRDERIAEVGTLEMQVAEAKRKSLEDREYLSPAEVATILGVGRSTIYRHLRENNIEVIQTRGRTRIKREDIPHIFGTHIEHRAQPHRQEVITELYSIQDIVEKYGVSIGWVHKIIKSHNIPKILKCGKTYISCSHIDKVFAEKAADPTIDEWYSVAEIESKFNMSKAKIYHCACEHQIPKRKEGKMVYYSKHHFNIAQGIEQPVEQEWYTVEEAMAKFELTRDSLYHHVKRNNITKIKSGRYIKISKTDLDNLFIKQILL